MTDPADPKGPVLDPAQGEEFAKALGNQAPEEPAAPAASEPPAPTPAAKETPAPAVPAAEPDPTQPVPYDTYKKTLEERAAYEREVAQLKTQADEIARLRAAQMLEDLARAHPERQDLQEFIYGKERAEQMRAALGPKPEDKAPENPIERRVWQLERNLKEQAEWRQTQERKELLDNVEARCESAMEKIAEFKSPMLRKIGEQIIAHQVMSRRDATPEKIVEEVGSLVRAAVEEQKALYKESKQQTAKNVPVGTGSGAAAPPGTGARKLSMNDNSARKALADALNSLSQGT